MRYVFLLLFDTSINEIIFYYELHRQFSCPYMWRNLPSRV